MSRNWGIPKRHAIEFHQRLGRSAPRHIAIGKWMAITFMAAFLFSFSTYWFLYSKPGADRLGSAYGDASVMGRGK